MKNMEIERQFLLKQLPDLQPVEHASVYQGYISINPEIRIRSYEVLVGENKGKKNYKLTIKSDGDLSRKEIETFLDEEFFNKAAEFIGLPLIHKSYYIFEHDGHMLECSVVDTGRPTTFTYGEVEFATEEDAKAFTWPFEGAIEVTYNPEWKMKNYWHRTRIYGDQSSTLRAYENKV